MQTDYYERKKKKMTYSNFRVTHRNFGCADKHN